MNTPKTPFNDQIKDILENSKTVAVIGCSSNPYRTSFHIAKYLRENGFTIIPINPNENEVFGEESYDSILDLPDDVQVDIIDIFRNKKYTKEMVDEIVAWSERTDQKPLIWTQLDVSTDDSQELAEKNGFPYVENLCLMVEHRRTDDG